MLSCIGMKYHKLKRIGEGTYGKVFQARDVVNGHIVALKKVKSDSEEISEEGIPSTTLREISCLKLIDH